MIDGEGSLTITHTTDKRYLTTHEKYLPRLAIVNTNLEVLLYLQRLIGGRIQIHTNRPNRKTTYVLYLSSSKMRSLLPHILDCLIVKQRQARLMIEYLDLVRPGISLPERNPEERRRMEEIREEIKRLNRRGVVELDGVMQHG